MSTIEEVTAAIVAKGDTIRQLKTAKASKEEIDKHVKELLSLKESFKTLNNGVPYDPPKTETKKEEKPKQVQETTHEGPSKKELNKIARKEKKNANKSSSGDSKAPAATEPTKSTDPNGTKQTAVSKPTSDVATVEPTTKKAPTVSNTISSSVEIIPLPSSLEVVYHQGNQVPELSRMVANILGVNVTVSLSKSSSPHLPYLNSMTKTTNSISGDPNIARYLCRSSLTKNMVDLYCNADPWLATEVDQWLDMFTQLSSLSDLSSKLIPILHQHLELNTFIVGNSLTLADIAMYLLLKKINFKSSFESDLVRVSRWYDLILFQLKKFNANASSVTSSKAGDNPMPTSTDSATDYGGACPPLEGAVEGAVCTRFPPEPSGYLHIGHAKAVLLNQYYAQRYKGKLLVRFDDTNPSKEKDEFAENILQDLATLGVVPHQVSHTSDHFATCEELSRQLIRDGLAYMDDTDQEKMQAERMEHIESYRRNTSPEENLELFEKLLLGEKEAQTFCLRAKIDMHSVNGTMRDPVLYRYNETPHLRTGTKYKAYPTYDLACPIVDSIEGVTHALRTTEYNDRDEQYHWLQNAMKLRPVHITAFGKMNFVNTVLSKRKLTWFVENKLVEGWFDPRFPTIQGCIRRGMNVEALKNFILSQGASRRVITMEWDKFWAENKKVLEANSPRYMGVSLPHAVELVVKNVSSDVELTSIQIHPQRPEMGFRVLRRLNKLIIDQADAALFKEGEEVTFIRWGNFFIDKIHKGADGIITSMEGRYNPEATNFSKTKKTTWLANVPDLVKCTLVEFDHIISKPKLEEDEDFKNFVNPNTRFESEALCDPCVRSLQRGDVIQLERKGFYRVDVPYSGVTTKPMMLFAIPDGKQKPNVAAATTTTTTTAPATKKNKKK